MARRPRRNHGPAFKAKVAVAANKGEKTMIELAQDFDLQGPSPRRASSARSARQAGPKPVSMVRPKAR